MLSTNIEKVQELSRKTYFTVDDVAQKFDLAPASARVFCSRYTSKGLLVRLKNNFYMTASQWENLTRRKLFEIANILQVPSYISLTSALAYYEVTTQAQGNYQESICLKRSVSYNIRDAFFKYYKLQRQYYFDFVKIDGLFIATKEKAFLDAAYLYSFGKYRLDYSAIDMNKLDKKKLDSLLKFYPAKTKGMVKGLCRI